MLSTQRQLLQQREARKLPLSSEDVRTITEEITVGIWSLILVFSLSLAYVGFSADRVALGQVFLQTLHYQLSLHEYSTRTHHQGLVHAVTLSPLLKVTKTVKAKIKCRTALQPKLQYSIWIRRTSAQSIPNLFPWTSLQAPACNQSWAII
jgi:hypothetical protein